MATLLLGRNLRSIIRSSCRHHIGSITPIGNSRTQSFSSTGTTLLENEPAPQQSSASSRSPDAVVRASESMTSEFELEGVDDHQIPLMQRIRIVPDSPSYFSARPKFTDSYLQVEEQYLRWKTLPRTETIPQILWHDFASFRAQTGNEPIDVTRYRVLVKMLRELSAIEPILMPPEVTQLLNAYKRAYQPALVKPREFAVDEWGRSLGVGKRKTSTAKAYLVMGEGEVLVNGKNITQHFGRVHDRESALWPLKITNRMDKYNVFGVVGGGGVTGQAEALTLAVARALLVHEPALNQRLLEAGCLYRDPRVVERKKPGHLKARKKPAWVKR